MRGVDQAEVLVALEEAAAAVAGALADVPDWGLTGVRPGEHYSDRAADAAAVAVLERAGFGVLSEESGGRGLDRDVVVVVDPLDGSTNAAQGIPWFATSLCAVDARGPLAALVVDLSRGTTFEAVRGGAPRRDRAPILPSGASRLADSIVGVSGLPPRRPGWRQYRALGAAALDLCLVASGGLDGYVDCSVDAHGVWDYLGGLLVCQEAGAVVVDALGRDLVTLEHADRRTPVAAATPALLEELLARRSP